MLEAHDRQRSSLSSKVRFESGEEQLVFETRMGFERKGEGGKAMLERRKRVQCGKRLLDVTEKKIEDGVFAKKSVSDEHKLRDITQGQDGYACPSLAPAARLICTRQVSGPSS